MMNKSSTQRSIKQLAGLPTAQGGLTRLAADCVRKAGIKLGPLLSGVGLTIDQIDATRNLPGSTAAVSWRGSHPQFYSGWPSREEVDLALYRNRRRVRTQTCDGGGQLRDLDLKQAHQLLLLGQFGGRHFGLTFRPRTARTAASG
jgi:hypothetical protein